jgi:hypothetical protein
VYYKNAVLFSLPPLLSSPLLSSLLGMVPNGADEWCRSIALKARGARNGKKARSAQCASVQGDGQNNAKNRAEKHLYRQTSSR